VEQTSIQGWTISHDRDATRVAYGQIAAGGADGCTCDMCRNWVLSRHALLPTAFKELLDQLGIPLSRDAELVHYARLDSGLHLYGGWYHLVGSIVSGEREGSPPLTFPPVAVLFHSRHDLVAEPFAKHSVVQLYFHCEVPWLSALPEAE
jgi:hypothetical protein